MIRSRGAVHVANAELTRKVRYLCAKVRDKQKIARRKESLTFHVAFAVYCRSGADEKTLKTFFEQHVSEIGFQNYMRWKIALEARYVDSDPEVIADIIEGAGAHRTSAIQRRATRWLGEYELYTWVLQKNYEQGVAPSYKSLFLKRDGLEKQNEIIAEPLAAWCARRKGTRWKKRFRRDWGLQTGVLPAKEVIPEDVTQQKATRRGREKTH